MHWCKSIPQMQHSLQIFSDWTAGVPPASQIQNPKSKILYPKSKWLRRHPEGYIATPFTAWKSRLLNTSARFSGLALESVSTTCGSRWALKILKNKKDVKTPFQFDDDPNHGLKAMATCRFAVSNLQLSILHFQLSIAAAAHCIYFSILNSQFSIVYARLRIRLVVSSPHGSKGSSWTGPQASRLHPKSKIQDPKSKFKMAPPPSRRVHSNAVYGVEKSLPKHFSPLQRAFSRVCQYHLR